MVNRNDRAVTATVTGGHIVYAEGQFARRFGRTLHAGTFLRAHNSKNTTVATPVPSAR